MKKIIAAKKSVAGNNNWNGDDDAMDVAAVTPNVADSKRQQHPLANPPRSPRIRRFASHLAVIQISLNPPSPPPTDDAERAVDNSVDAGATADECDSLAEATGSSGSAAPSLWPYHYVTIDDSRLLQVPRGIGAADSEDALAPTALMRQCSPPPRRFSQASTFSEDSSASLTASYQNLLLSPWNGLASRRNSLATTTYAEDDEYFTTDYDGDASTAPGSRRSSYYSYGSGAAAEYAAEHQTHASAADEYGRRRHRLSCGVRMMALGGGGYSGISSLIRRYGSCSGGGGRSESGSFDSGGGGSGRMPKADYDLPSGSITPMLRPLSALSTPIGDGASGIGLNSPTVLLSPVLSRPVRSQSAHAPPFLIARSASACCTCATGAAISDSEESESAAQQQLPSTSGDAALLTRQRKASSMRHQQEQHKQCHCADGGRSGSGTPPPSLNSLFRLKGSGCGGHHGQLTSQPQHSRHHLSTSAQKLHSLPGSGSFSRSTTNWQNGLTSGSGGYTNSPFFTASLAYHHNHNHHHHCHQHHNSNNNGSIRSHQAAAASSNKRPPLHHTVSQCCGNSLSHQDSFESSASGPAATSAHQPSVFALPASAASAVFLQRSHSDAQELRHHYHNNNRRSGSRTPQPPQRQSSTTCCPTNASFSGGPSPRQQQQQSSPSTMSEQQWSRMRHIRRRPSTSLRAGISNADFLNNSSLDSNGGGVFSSTTTGGYLFPYSMLNNSSSNNNNLMRWKYCPLGHSDPQIYTFTPNGGGFLGNNASPAVSATSQASPCSSTVSDTHRHSMASSCGSGRRSFLSASPLTTKFRKDSLLLTSPRASIVGSSSGGHTRRRLTETLHHSSPSPHHYSPGGTRTHHHGHNHHLGGVERHHTGRRSIGGDCTLGGASLSSSATRLRVRSSIGAAHSLLPHQPQPSTSSASAVLIRPRAHCAAAQPSNGSGSNLPPPKADNRRWSLASLPSSSGYGTPGSNSAFSSQYSSQEHLAELMMDLRMNAQHHFDSNESYSCFEDAILGFRPRSRSLNSPVRSGIDFGAETGGHQIMSSVYKERFPKAKEQMENRLQQFLASNAPLSGFTTSAAALNLPPPTPNTTQQQPLRSASPNRNFTLPLNGSGSGGAASPQQSPTTSGSRLSRHPSSSHHHHRSSSPRPTSPLPQRPISPLAMESATVIDGGAGGMVFRSISTSQYSAGNSGSYGGGGGNLLANAAVSPSGSSFNLYPLSGGNQEASVSTSFSASAAAAAAASFSGGGGNASTSSSTATTNNSGSLAPGPPSGSAFNRSHRSSFMVAQPGETLTAGEQSLLRLICDGATRFLHHQICEICADCLQKSRDDLLTCAYFCSMSVRLDETLAEAEVKVGPESYKYLASLVRQILMIVSRTARLLECLEFNPDEFYHLLEEAEGAVRVQLGSGNARVPDLPQYIISKLGLNKNLLMDQVDQQTLQDEESDATTLLLQQQQQQNAVAVEKTDSAVGLRKVDDHAQLGMAIARNAPSEEDFETIRLISNGAYGAVYLVRHKQTRQRFALKKMKKQTLILRNQVDQVYAERDILTFTDNPFVVCFYGSFETKQHLCMLMEYVEGGDCAALLKSAGTLPIELARLYVAETVLAIEYLHSCGIVHRDLKPDNLLITTMGHIKLTDFGLSKIGLMNRTTLVSEGYLLDDTQQFKDNQLCGTPEYIAPCVILRQGYGKPVDWWALGIILYEFLVGIVPFTGDTPEQLFANIINEEVEYPDGDEALDPNAESLIRLLLEKNPVDRLGTVGGAAEVAAHSFFASLDFDSLLRQKAEFVPQLENDEDTSYFDSREDRYNHDAESGDDDAVPMFWSFSTASPRHSIVGMDIPSGALAGLQALAESSGAGGGGGSSGDASGSESQPLPRTPSAGRPPSTGIAELAESRQLYSSEDSSSVLISSSFVTGSRTSAFSAVTKQNSGSGNISADVPLGDVAGRLPPPSSSGGFGSGTRMGMDNNQPIPSAVILRRRFSTQRHANLSTSSSGTTTGTGPLNTCSSTDSSMDAAHFAAIGMDSAPLPSYGGAPRRHNTVSAAPLPRFAISPCGSRNSDIAADVLPQHNRAPLIHGGGGVRRATVGGTEYFQQQRDVSQSFGGGIAGSASCGNGSNSGGVELSPVDETAGARREDSEQSLHQEMVGGVVSEANKEDAEPAASAKRGAMEKRPSTVVHDLITSDTASKTTGGNIAAVVTSGGDTQPLGRSTRSASCRSSTTAVSSNNNSLRVMIPPQHHHAHGSSGASSPQPGSGGSMSTSYYHSYGNTSGGGGSQLSPSCASVSSGSSFELSGTNIAEGSTEGVHLRQIVGGSGVSLPQRASISSTSPLLISSGGNALLQPQPSSTLVQQLTNSTIPAHHQPSSSSSKTIVIRKGLQGYGFTIRSVRVYLSEASEYYTIEHIVAAVREPSPAHEAGLRVNDLITHIHTQSVHNLTHPQLMHRLLSCGNDLTLHVVPLQSTSIREGEARRSVGKLLRKRPRKPAAHAHRRAVAAAAAAAGLVVDKKGGRKASSSALLRRLSGKRVAGDIVPGSSSQKQTFMPRSVSSQDGALSVSPSATKQQQPPPSQQQSQRYLTTDAAAAAAIGPQQPTTSDDAAKQSTRRASSSAIAGKPNDSTIVTLTARSGTTAAAASLTRHSSTVMQQDVATQQQPSPPRRPSATLMDAYNKIHQPVAQRPLTLNTNALASTGSSNNEATLKPCGGSLAVSSASLPCSNATTASRTMPLSPLARQSSSASTSTTMTTASTASTTASSSSEKSFGGAIFNTISNAMGFGGGGSTNSKTVTIPPQAPRQQSIATASAGRRISSTKVPPSSPPMMGHQQQSASNTGTTTNACETASSMIRRRTLAAADFAATPSLAAACSSADRCERPSTSGSNKSNLQACSNRSPSPSRKVSPSRIVQRLFRASSAIGPPPPNVTAPSPK